MRVQIPVYTDRWMMGDRYGEIVKTSKRHARAAGVRAAILTGSRFEASDIAHVRLDSGKVVRVVLDDCRPV